MLFTCYYNTAARKTQDVGKYYREEGNLRRHLCFALSPGIKASHFQREKWEPAEKNHLDANAHRRTGTEL